MKRSRITCQILKEQYKELQNIAESYEKKVMTEGPNAEETKKIKNTFDTTEKKIREAIEQYRVRREILKRLSKEEDKYVREAAATKPQRPRRYPKSTFKKR